MAARSTREVLAGHLHQSVAGDVETDLQRNYSRDAVVLVGFGVFRGHEGLREANRLLQAQLPGATYEYRTPLESGEIAFLEWSAHSDSAHVEDGADSYHVRDGRIQVQTIHYTLIPTRKEHDMATDQTKMDRCIDECFAVVRTASRCADSCLGGGQAGEMADCIRLCLDAATITGACAELMSRNSRSSGQACVACADICDACAQECEKYDGELMRQCAETCRRCAESCRQMTG